MPSFNSAAIMHMAWLIQGISAAVQYWCSEHSYMQKPLQLYNWFRTSQGSCGSQATCSGRSPAWHAHIGCGAVYLAAVNATVIQAITAVSPPTGGYGSWLLPLGEKGEACSSGNNTVAVHQPTNTISPAATFYAIYAKKGCTKVPF